MNSNKTWVLVAEQSRARLFELSNGALKELEGFSHAAARRKKGDLTTDKQGRAMDRGGRGRHAMDPPTDAHRNELGVFARQLVSRLETGRSSHAFGKLVFVAPPRFLGELRRAAGDDLAAMVSRSIEKNLVQAGPDKILEAVRELPD
jgi:protein required for attachment to host cells